MDSQITEIALALITTVLGGKFLWDYLKKSKTLKSKENMAKLTMQSGDKKELLGYLEKQNNSLLVKMEALEEECDQLREENKNQASQIAVLNERLWHYASRSRGGKKEPPKK